MVTKKLRKCINPKVFQLLLKRQGICPLYVLILLYKIIQFRFKQKLYWFSNLFNRNLMLTDTLGSFFPSTGSTSLSIFQTITLRKLLQSSRGVKSFQRYVNCLFFIYRVNDIEEKTCSKKVISFKKSPRLSEFQDLSLEAIRYYLFATVRNNSSPYRPQ